MSNCWYVIEMKNGDYYRGEVERADLSKAFALADDTGWLSFEDKSGIVLRLRFDEVFSVVSRPVRDRGDLQAAVELISEKGI